MSRGVCVSIVPAGSSLSTDEADLRTRGQMSVLPPDVDDFGSLQGFVSTLPGFPSGSSTCSYLRTFTFGKFTTQGWAYFAGELPEGPVIYVKVEIAPPPSVPSSRSLDAIFGEWKLAYGDFITKFLQQGGLGVQPQWGVPVGFDGRPSILFHKLQDRWTSDSDAWKLLDYTLRSKKSGCIPLMGVSGCGKTRTVFEILAANWGFFWTASSKRNGGSQDMALVGNTEPGSDPECRKHFAAVIEMKKLILARLLVLQQVLSIKPDLTPEQWLILQTEFNHFCGTEDPYKRLAMMLVSSYEFQQGDLIRLWDAVCSMLSCKPIFVRDEAQTLNGTRCFQSPQSHQLRARFSPVMKALMDVQLAAPVFASGTGINFLELENDILSLVGKMRGARLPLYVIKFDKWEKPREVYDFCIKYLPVLGLTARNCALLFSKFKGRKRCLVTCLEELLRNGCCWKKETVDAFYADLTTGDSSDFSMSLYSMVASFFQTGKGTFRFRGRDLSARELVMRAVSHYCFSNRAGLVLDSAEAHLLVSGLGSCERVRSWESRSSYEISEPMVLAAMTNYCVDNDHLERHLQVLMQSLVDDPAACGNLWEKLVVIHIPRFLDGQKPLNSWPCFKGLDLQNWGVCVPKLAGLNKQVWRETPAAPLSAYLKLPRGQRPMFFMFSSLSGPDIMFFVMLGDLLVPVFLQLKLRRQVQWDQAEGTTNPSKMYRRTSKQVSTAAIPALKEACFYGCISLVVAYPASDPKAPRWLTRRLVGYLGKDEVKEIFSSELCDFLAAIKSDFPDYKTYKELSSTTSLRAKRVKKEEYDDFQDF
ncbi:hypothetical protein SELMODRAFT_424880 [Selaginella moellendorffii]|uniref:Uncharacterized protein n=1 Tax=Selaginella moellendorffii TaxID=88036 RepID=D8SRB0_SELML|nr:hypothetical protein SELMODRAFT_424880 [Selaginella moellendorffii]